MAKRKKCIVPSCDSPVKRGAFCGEHTGGLLQIYRKNLLLCKNCGSVRPISKKEMRRVMQVLRKLASQQLIEFPIIWEGEEKFRTFVVETEYCATCLAPIRREKLIKKFKKDLKEVGLDKYFEEWMDVLEEGWLEATFTIWRIEDV